MEKETASSDEIQLVAFKVGREEYGVDISQVREIIKMTKITKIPKAPVFLEGVINLRGDITAVMDLKKRLGLFESDEKTDNTRIIIVDVEGTTMGMIVDSVSEVLRLPVKDIDPTPSITTEVETQYIKGVGKIKERLLILLDLSKVLSKKEVVQLKQIQR